MHTLHTTEAFVLSGSPHGESNRVYRLLTRDHGLLYAHGQGVRELKNRNRFALATGRHAIVTLVRGREVWRITGAQEQEQAYTTAAWRRALMLTGRLLAAEDPAPRVFDILMHARGAFTTALYEQERLLEALTAFQLLHELGYIACPEEPVIERVIHTVYTTKDLANLASHQQKLVHMVNDALTELPIR